MNTPILVYVGCSGFHVDSVSVAATALIVGSVPTASTVSRTPTPGNVYAANANVYVLYVR